MIQTISFPNLGIEFVLNRIAFTVFGINVYWYGIIIACGLLAAIGYALYAAKYAGLKQDDLLNMLLIALPVSIICARLYYVAFSWSEFKDNPIEIFDIRSGGIAVYGSLIGAALVVFTYCKVKKIKIGMVLDILAIGFLIGQAIGRWGNFVNGEAFGSVTNLPWGMSIWMGGALIANHAHPTFLYESLWNAVGILILLQYKRFKKFDGEVFCGYMVWYGLGRAWIEGLRMDSLYIGMFRVSQVLAVLSVIAGIICIVYGRRKIAAAKQSAVEIENDAAVIESETTAGEGENGGA